MATRVLLTGIPGYVSRFGRRTEGVHSVLRARLPRPRSKADLIKETQSINNTGNYLIGDGALAAFQNADVTYVPFWCLSSQLKKPDLRVTINERFDFVVLVTANLLRNDYSAESEAQAVAMVDRPIVIMGIGLQRKEDLAAGLPPGTMRFLEEVRKREHYVFTRGTETADYLKSVGLKSVVPTGCPSLFYDPDNMIKAMRRLKEHAFCAKQRFVYHGYLGASSSSIRDMNRFGATTSGRAFVLQDEFLHYGLELKCAEEEQAYDEARGEIVCPTDYRGRSDLNGTGLPLHMFFNTDQWRAWISTFDFCFGRRFHGTIVAMQAGTPALSIAVDDRMREMLSYSGIPAIDVDRWEDGRPAEAVIDDTVKSYDLAQSVDRYSANASRFRSELAALGF